MSDIHEAARTLGVPTEALELVRAADVIDLHIDSFIWARLLRYDLNRAHHWRPLGRRYLGQVDFPRAIDAALTGAMWSITTNPFRSARGRDRTFINNLERLKTTVSRADGIDLVRSVAEYRTAQAAGRHGAFLAVQGGHALSDPATAARDISRITLVHLNSSVLGETSSPTRRLTRVQGLSAAGRSYVEACNQHRILVDLAHASPRCFWDAVDTHDPDVPLIVTHTGVAGVHPVWRNLDDDQIRAVANSGGCIGVMFHEPFLGAGPATVGSVADHLDHIVRVGGEDIPAIGTDLDGAVVPPKDLQGHGDVPRLVHALAKRGWTNERILKALGGNALRTIEAVRG